MKKVKHIYLNYSTYDQYYKCKRKFQYHSLHHLVSTRASHADLDPSCEAFFKGQLVHNSLDAWNQGKEWEPVFDAMIKPHYAINSLKDTQSGSIKHMKDLIRAYFKHYNNERRQIVFSERKLMMPLNDKVTLVGTLDEAMMRGDKIILVDHKTSSSLSQFMEPTMHVSDQFTMYIMLAQAAGIDTDTLMINGISTGKAALDRFETDDPDHRLFMRYETSRTRDQIDEFREMIEFESRRMIEDIENETFTKTPDKGTCVAFHKKCPYLYVCGKDAAVRSKLLASDFKHTTTELDNLSFKVEYEE